MKKGSVKKADKEKAEMEKVRIGVVGGGASGIMAAIIAARQGASVTLLEGGERVGKKILSTGNGKCNLGNLNLCAEDYNGAGKKWLEKCLKQFGNEEAIHFFEGLGLLLREKNGYEYPYAEQASVVLDVLRMGLEEADVEVVTECKVQEIRRMPLRQAKERQGFFIEGENRSFWFDKVILACGSKAAPKTGSDGSGYRLAEKLGHKIVPVVPALVQLRCREAFFKEIAGVRLQALVTVEHGAEKIQESGELQLTDYGISGIPVFQLSRKVNYILRGQGKGAEVEVRLDLLPEYSIHQVREKIFLKRLERGQKRGQNGSEWTVEEFFTGILNKKIMYLLIKLAGLKRETKVCDADRKNLWRVLELCKDFRVYVTGSNSFEQAQVCAGGVDTGEVAVTMESKLVPGLYFAGELLDVDGRCGGYNLHWAWCSGFLAGKNAAGAGREA